MAWFSSTLKGRSEVALFSKKPGGWQFFLIKKGGGAPERALNKKRRTHEHTPLLTMRRCSAGFRKRTCQNYKCLYLTGK